MILLSATTYTLQLVLSAGTADVDISYADKTASAYTGGTQQTAATATTQTICAAPAASTVREIDNLSVQIKTTGGTVTVQKLNSSGPVTTQLIAIVLAVGEQLTYVHGSGWCAMDANGNRKEVSSSIFSSLTVTGTSTQAAINASGLITAAAGITLSGTVSNISTGANFIGSNGTDAGLSFASNNGAFSGTLTVTDKISCLVTSGSFFDAISATTGTNWLHLANTGADAYVGIEGSAGGAIISGTSAYSLVLGQFANRQVHIGSNNTIGITVNGSAVTMPGVLAIGNTVASAVAIASTHKVTVVIGGVTYYLLASNV